MLKKIRVAFAIFFFTATALLFLDFTGTLHEYLGWCAKIQFVPVIFAMQLSIFLGIILLTLLFGRLYCSIICPLGIFQDIISRLASLKNKTRFSYKKPRKGLVVLRYSLLALFALAALAAICLSSRRGTAIVSVLEPYSAFGRMVSQIFGPVYKYGNNWFAYFAERMDSYAFYPVDIWLKSSVALALAIITFAVVTLFAYKSGRGYCSSICPVGAFLGLLSKYSFIKPRIDLSKCKHCNLCAKNCKASCIDTSAGEIDYSRCVACFNCMDKCTKNAIAYSLFTKRAAKKKETENLSEDGLARRNFISGSAVAVLGCIAKAQARQGDGGLTELADKKAPLRSTPIVPAGAASFKNFHDHCTGCQLCVSVCPNQVLRPYKATKPVMSYERGYCRSECVKCSEVCPTGALKPVTRAEKSSIQIGYAVWKPDFCIVNTDKAACDTCARKCPSATITMVAQNANDPASLKIPAIDTSRCIGCGACEHLCPSRPHSAIYVEGIEIHRVI
jgi:polyferredoxin